MKILSILFIAILFRANLICEEIWVGIYVIEHADKEPRYWLGSFEKLDYDELMRGNKTKGYVVLNNVCYWDSIEQGDKSKWFVVEQKDEVGLGKLVIKPDKIDRMFLLDGDPRKKNIYKDKDGNKINKENW